MSFFEGIMKCILWFSITYSTSIKTMETCPVNKMCFCSYWIIFGRTNLWLHLYLMWRWCCQTIFFCCNFSPYNWSGVHSMHAWQNSVYKHCDCKLGSAVCNLLHWFSQTVCSPGSHRCWLHGSGIGEHDIPSDAVLARRRNCAFQEDVHVCVSLRVVEALYVSEIKSKLSWNSKIHVHLFKRVTGCKTHLYMLFEHNMYWQCVYTTTL